MKRQVLSQDTVNELIQSSFIPVRLSAASNLGIMDDYGAIGAPSFVVLSPDGEKLGVRGGLMSETQFLSFLKSHVSPDMDNR